MQCSTLSCTLDHGVSSVLCRLLKSISFVLKWKHVVSVLSPLSHKSWSIKNNTVTNSYYKYIKRITIKTRKNLPQWQDSFSRCHFHLSRTKGRWMSYFWGELLIKAGRTKEIDIEADHLTKQYEISKYRWRKIQCKDNRTVI